MTCKKYYVDISTSAVYQTRWTNCLYWFFSPQWSQCWPTIYQRLWKTLV